MDAIYPALVTIFVRGGIAILLVIGGIYALYIGLKIFNTKVGTNKDAATVELGPFKANTKTIGSFVMVTACFWGYLSVKVSPTYKTEQVEVAINKVEEISSQIDMLAAATNDIREKTTIQARVLSRLNDDMPALFYYAGHGRNTNDIDLSSLLRNVSEWQTSSSCNSSQDKTCIVRGGQWKLTLLPRPEVDKKEDKPDDSNEDN